MKLKLAKVERVEKKYKKGLSQEEYLINLFNGELPIKHAYSAPIAPGNCRADHFHERKKEYVSVIRGRVRLTLKDVATGRKEIVILDSFGEEIKRVEVSALLAHRIENIGDVMAEVIILSTEVYDEEDPDVVFYPTG
jgi:dTDP-4-dehydrorhamnose 3,5-epimerase-like enzyme